MSNSLITFKYKIKIFKHYYKYNGKFRNLLYNFKILKILKRVKITYNLTFCCWVIKLKKKSLNHNNNEYNECNEQTSKKSPKSVIFTLFFFFFHKSKV